MEIHDIVATPLSLDLASRPPALKLRTVGGDDVLAYVSKATPINRMARLSGEEVSGRQLLRLDNQRLRDDTFSRLSRREPLVFRVDENGNLRAVVSQQFAPLNVESLVPLVEKQFPGAEMTVRPSDGWSGGMVAVTLDDVEGVFMRRILNIVAGVKDGMHSVKVLICGSIIVCTNQLTGLVRDRLGGLLDTGMDFFLHRRHSTNALTEDWFHDVLDRAERSSHLLTAAVEESKEWQLDDGEAKQILTYYWDQKFISGKTAIGLYGAYQAQEVAQVPKTMYGMAMAASWYGTHIPKLAGGVQERTRQMAGELVLVSPHTDRFFDEVVGRTNMMEGPFSPNWKTKGEA